MSGKFLTLISALPLTSSAISDALRFPIKKSTSHFKQYFLSINSGKYFY